MCIAPLALADRGRQDIVHVRLITQDLQMVALRPIIAQLQVRGNRRKRWQARSPSPGLRRQVPNARSPATMDLQGATSWE
jgi:hypothetical protein